MTDRKPKKPNDIDLQVARNIRQLRKAKKMSQGHISEILGISFQQYQKIEKGTNRVTIGRFVKIAEVLEVPPMVLLDQAVPIIYNY